MAPADASSGAAPEAVSRVGEIAELVKRLCLALTQVEMFSASHPMAQGSIKAAFEWLQGIFARRQGPVVISVSDKRILLEGMPLEDKNPLVARLGAKLHDFHVTNLLFQPALTAPEFQAFYAVLGKGPRYVNEHGGLAALLAGAQVQNVQLRAVSYVMVTEDEKVVSRSAVVTDAASSKSTADTEIVKYMLEKVLQEAETQQWLLEEIKNQPARMANLIAEGIELAVSRAEAGLGKPDDTVATLMDNIKLVAAGMAQADERGEGDPEALRHSIVALENELRLRSSKLMSSKVAQGFLNEILAVITAHADKMRARHITDEFLRDEAGLKRTEKLLKSLVPQGDGRTAFLERIRPLLAERGIGDEQFARLLREAARSESPRPPKPRRPRRPASQAIEEGVARRLKDLPLDKAQRTALTASLSAFVEERVRERSGEIRAQAERLQADVRQRTAVLETLPWGVLLWDADGQPAYANPAARAIVGTGELPSLRDPLRRLLAEGRFPLPEPPELPGDAAPLTEPERRLLLACMQTFHEADGQVYGVCLEPGPRAP